MKELKRTSADPLDGHYHIVYLDPEEGTGQITPGEDHLHEIQFVPPQEAQIDEQTGQELAPAQPGYYEISPGPDGHQHTIEDYQLSFPKKRTKPDEVVAEVYELYRVWKEGESDSIKKGRESEDFRKGNQWSSKVKAYLEDMNRAAVTLNWTGKYVDELKGYQMQQRTDIKYLPVEGGDSAAADLVSIVSKQILDQCYYQREKSKVFEDEIVTGRGIFSVGVRNDKDPRGEIYVEKFPWDQAVFGPHEKEDLSDCEGYIKHRMYSYAKLEQDWPDKIKDIKRDYKMLNDPEFRKKHVQFSDDQYAHSDNKYPGSINVAGDTMVDLGKKEYRVLECWRKVYLTVPVVSAPDYSFYFNAYGWKSDDLDKIKSIPGFYIIKMPSTKIRITKVAGGVLLSDEDPADLPIDDFFLVPVYAYKNGDSFWGKVEAVKDPQREINYRRSQSIDIGNKYITPNIFIKPNTFSDEAEKQRFKDKGSSAGGVYELGPMGDLPMKHDGSEMPSALVQLIERGMQEVSELMNITVGQGGANTSGSAFLQREKIRLTGNEFLFDSLAFAEQKIGRLLVSLIQRYYDADRIARIVNHYADRRKVTIAGETYESFSEDKILEILENSDLSKLDVVVSESNYSPSARTATFTLLTELAQGGTPVPPEVLVEFSPLPEEQRQRIIEGIQQQNEAQSQAAQQSNDSEVEKTLVGQGIIPPATAQRFGLNNTPPPQQQPPEQARNNGELPPPIA